MTSRGNAAGVRLIASVLLAVLALCGSRASAEMSLTDSLRIASSSFRIHATTEWNDLPNYRHERIVPWKLATAIAGVGVYDLAFYQTLKKPWWSGETSRFHVINDWWGGYALEVDKLGHAFAAQSLTLISAETYRWAGMSRREALFWGGVSSLATMTQIEVLDGFTTAYGFSPADYTANIVGAFWPLAQELWRPLGVVTFKMSYHTARFEQAAAPNVIEDYNRQTYWLAFDVNRMIPEPTRGWWPDWLGVAVGYGVTNAFTYVSHREYNAIRPHRSYLVTRRPAHMMREYYV
ncbi:MAG TPA: DUF2279 domain-containing protein, partial [Firmicutes bacterium]|nr:DUF2279 domain-containing protein [Bacillota bacterium]